MKRFLLVGLALVLVIGLHAQPARAQNNVQNNNWNAFWAWISHNQDPRLTVVGIGVGAAATGASYAMVKKHGNPPVRPAEAGPHRLNARSQDAGRAGRADFDVSPGRASIGGTAPA